eukprot:5400001-Prymnesium_polylepis.3
MKKVDEECLRRSLLPKVNPLVEAQKKAREAAAKKKAEEMMPRKGGGCSDSRGAGRVFTARRTLKVRRLTMLSARRMRHSRRGRDRHGLVCCGPPG